MIELLGLPEASTYAGDIDRIFTLIFWIVGAWFVVAEGVFFYFILRFRKKEGVRAQYISGELKSEKRWITIPHNLILLFDILILVFAVKVWYTVKQDLPDAPDKRVVRVIAQQWAWTFVDPGPDGQLDTPDDIAKVNEMHVVVDKIHHFKLESKDVLHSFSVPVFRLKQDVIPGRVITGWFTPTKTGTFDIQCVEICGIGHALMPAKIVIETPEQHAAWVAQNSNVAVASATAR
jgi:cytochrome c oxidase subunit II